MTTTELLLNAPQPHGHSSLAATPLGYQVRLAGTADEVLAAQRLRDEVFGTEGVASTPPTAAVDAQEFDDRCDHLIVWHQPAFGPPQAVATCRLLPPHSNDVEPRGGGLYADQTFGLMPLERLLESTVEAGMACVQADHRGGTAIALLLDGAARYLHLTGNRYLLATVSMGLQDGGRNAASFWDLALTGHLAPAERRCRPRDPIAIGRLERAARPQIPGPLRGCLRLGGKVCGPPGYDEMFGTAAFLVLFDTQTVNPRYLRRFLDTDG